MSGPMELLDALVETYGQKVDQNLRASLRRLVEMTRADGRARGFLLCEDASGREIVPGTVCEGEGCTSAGESRCEPFVQRVVGSVEVHPDTHPTASWRAMCESLYKTLLWRRPPQSVDCYIGALGPSGAPDRNMPAVCMTAPELVVDPEFTEWLFDTYCGWTRVGGGTPNVNGRYPANDQELIQMRDEFAARWREVGGNPEIEAYYNLPRTEERGA